jgi:hypothetical protein
MKREPLVEIHELDTALQRYRTPERLIGFLATLGL